MVRAPKVSDSTIAIIVIIITAGALNSHEKVVGDVGLAGEGQCMKALCNLLRRRCLALISIMPFEVLAVLELTVSRQEAELIISDSFQL